MITLYTVFTFIFFHWVLDFFFQTDEQAKGKSRSNKMLLKHVAVYTLGLALMGLLNLPFFESTHLMIVWVAVNAVLHFFTDYVTSRASSLLFEKENYHDAFVVIGADQMIHMFFLFTTYVLVAAEQSIA